MLKNISYTYILAIFLFSTISLYAQLNFTVNSLADDEYAYPYDNPDTESDESSDGICEDDLGRCTIRAAIEESINLGKPLNLSFTVNGTINLMDILYPEEGSIINGEGKIEIQGQNCFELYNNTKIKGLKFNQSFNPISIVGQGNSVGDSIGNNIFINNYIALIIEGDSNLVYSNYFGLDTNKVLGPNYIGIMISGSNNVIGKSGVNTICGSQYAGISLDEGSNNTIINNVIGTTTRGDLGYGNMQA